MPEGRQSPPPERQTGAQQQSPPASGHGTDKFDNKEETLKSQVDNLTSNPPGPLDEAVKDKFAKSKCKRHLLLQIQPLD
ncbi:hypothetical protein B0I35DRAFT_481635 [Stachybotrys elegans]|uniref:Uncharacterized protein n=1 Tax=Stachybotrys elegans TaxID=80388 RepID=A0A8K0SK38_9HYPO|nr:hypothetical protein B0I35DRAFT_481635 [Stachybotrys elegans]